MRHRLSFPFLVFCCLTGLAGCGEVGVQSAATAAATTTVAPVQRSLTDTADTRQLRGCLHCAP